MGVTVIPELGSVPGVAVVVIDDDDDEGMTFVGPTGIGNTFIMFGADAPFIFLLSLN